MSWKMSLKRPSYFFMIVFLVDMNYITLMSKSVSHGDGRNRTRGIFLESAILNDECANPVID